MSLRPLLFVLPLILQEEGAAYGQANRRIGKLSAPLRHQLSHQTIFARFLEVEVDHLPHPLPQKWQPVALEERDPHSLEE